MGLLDLIFKRKNKQNELLQQNDDFDEEEYNRYNNAKIKEFTDKYDLLSKDGIRSIPISEATKYPDILGISVVYMPEQILSRKATEYKKEKNFDLAIECLKKVNELLPYSPFSYTRGEYERLVDMMVLAGRFNEAKQEHKKLDDVYGTRLEELQDLQAFVVKMGEESKEEYQKRVIDPYLEEARDREIYYWLLENMPNIAPKSFGAYRRMKNLKSANYQKIVNELLKDGYNLEQLSFWY